MKYVFTALLLFSIISYSQTKKTNSKQDFNDKIVDFAIDNCEDKFIELPDLYEKTTGKIADDENEKLILVDKLKNRGFEVINWGRGNNPPLGPRIIALTLKKGNCECEVIKIYYSTADESQYQMTEKIKCKKPATSTQ
jgi:hypothetical protein